MTSPWAPSTRCSRSRRTSRRRPSEYRAELLEHVAESSDELLEKYLGGEELTIPEIKKGIRKMVLNAEIYPVLCGSAFKNRGVQPMLDAVVDYLPNPLDMPAIEGHAIGDEEKIVERHADAKEPFSALAFKIMTHPFFGRLTYIRVYSGHADSGAAVLNATKDKKERIGKIFQMHANKENPVDFVTAGHIYAVIGLKDTTTGDTLCDSSAPGGARVDDVPRARDPRGRGAQDQGRPREDVAGDPEARRRGPDVPRAPRRGLRPDRSSPAWASFTSTSSSTA